MKAFPAFGTIFSGLHGRRDLSTLRELFGGVTWPYRPIDEFPVFPGHAEPTSSMIRHIRTTYVLRPQMRLAR